MTTVREAAVAAVGAEAMVTRRLDSSGRPDGSQEVRTQPLDIAPLKLVVEECLRRGVPYIEARSLMIGYLVGRGVQNMLDEHALRGVIGCYLEAITPA